MQEASDHVDYKVVMERPHSEKLFSLSEGSPCVDTPSEARAHVIHLFRRDQQSPAFREGLATLEVVTKNKYGDIGDTFLLSLFTKKLGVEEAFWRFYLHANIPPRTLMQILHRRERTEAVELAHNPHLHMSCFCFSRDYWYPYEILSCRKVLREKVRGSIVRFGSFLSAPRLFTERCP